MEDLEYISELIGSASRTEELTEFELQSFNTEIKNSLSKGGFTPEFLQVEQDTNGVKQVIFGEDPLTRTNMNDFNDKVTNAETENLLREKGITDEAILDQAKQMDNIIKTGPSAYSETKAYSETQNTVKDIKSQPATKEIATQMDNVADDNTMTNEQKNQQIERIAKANEDTANGINKIKESIEKGNASSNLKTWLDVAKFAAVAGTLGWGVYEFVENYKRQANGCWLVYSGENNVQKCKVGGLSCIDTSFEQSYCTGQVLTNIYGDPTKNQLSGLAFCDIPVTGNCSATGTNSGVCVDYGSNTPPPGCGYKEWSDIFVSPTGSGPNPAPCPIPDMMGLKCGTCGTSGADHNNYPTPNCSTYCNNDNQNSVINRLGPNYKFVCINMSWSDAFYEITGNIPNDLGNLVQMLVKILKYGIFVIIAIFILSIIIKIISFFFKK